jgi:hypothetical protein
LNLQPMKSSAFTASGERMRVFCIQCGVTVWSDEVLCDMDGTFGSYYCPTCALQKNSIEINQLRE